MASVCPTCGAPLPSRDWEGLCPRCVARVTLSPESDGGDPAVVEPALSGPAAVFPAGFRLGDYELLAEIGRGGMGVVYRARQLSLNRTVAVKTILAGRMSDTEAVRRFRDEAEALAGLRHPHIVTIHEITEVAGHHLFSMEFVSGGSLAQRLLERDGGGAKGSAGNTENREVGLPPREAAALVAKVAEAVQHAHARGLLHRDLKPSNILLDEQGEPRVTDFGLAKRLHALTDLTYTGQLIGSPQYFAPEQFSPRFGVVGPHTDVFALGAVLYHLLTGRPPRHGETLEAVLLQLIDAVVVPPRKLRPTLPRELETICLKCLELDPRRRYPTAQAVADELRRFGAGEPILARPMPAARRMGRWILRHLAWVVAMLSVAATLLVGWQLWRRPPATPPSVDAVASGMPTTAFELRDGEFDPRHWRLEVASSGGGTTQTAGRRPAEDGSGMQWAVTNRLAGRAQVIGFHFRTNAPYDPALRGPITAVSLRVNARQVDGVTGAQVGVCLEQAGRRYLAPPVTMAAWGIGPQNFTAFSARDFKRCDGVTLRPGEHPDFSSRGAPVVFGFAVLDADAGQGHFGWAIIDEFHLTVRGRSATAFPFEDGEFRPEDWATLTISRGGASAVAGPVRNGRSGRGMQIASHLPAGSEFDWFAFSEGATYAPSQQGALAGVTVRFVVRENEASVGRQMNPVFHPVATQNGRMFVAPELRVGTYTTMEGGWQEMRFAGLRATNFQEQIGAGQFSQPLDFSTNGAPIRFGFVLRLTTDYRHEGGGFDTDSVIDDFRVEVEQAGGTAARRP